MKEKEISTEESMEIIQKMISIARDKFQDSGFHFILWGILVAVASLTQYLLNTQIEVAFPSYLVWPAMSVVGIPIAFIYEFRKSKKGFSRGKLDSIYSYLWLGFAITLVLIVLLSVTNRVAPVPFILAITGLAVFVSAIIYKYAPLMIGAIVFWLAASICPLFDPNSQLLINAVAITLGYIVPGILVWKRYVSAT